MSDKKKKEPNLQRRRKRKKALFIPTCDLCQLYYLGVPNPDNQINKYRTQMVAGVERYCQAQDSYVGEHKPICAVFQIAKIVYCDIFHYRIHSTLCVAKSRTRGCNLKCPKIIIQTQLSTTRLPKRISCDII